MINSVEFHKSLYEEMQARWVLGYLRCATYPAGYGVSRYWDIWSAACLSMLHVICLMTREVDIGRFYHALPRDAYRGK
jgi:hypothetical protein